MHRETNRIESLEINLTCVTKSFLLRLPGPLNGESIFKKIGGGKTRYQHVKKKKIKLDPYLTLYYKTENLRPKFKTIALISREHRQKGSCQIC